MCRVIKRDPITNALRVFVMDLLDVDYVVYGRLEFERKNDDDNIIAIDSLAQAATMIIAEHYDHVAEKITYRQRKKQRYTFDFYGEDAYENANRFSLLINGYKSQRLQIEYNITVGSVTSVIDLRTIESTVVGERFQVEAVIQYDTSVTEDLLRIDDTIIYVTEELDEFPEIKQKEVIVK